MDLEQAIKTRRSIRKYQNREVPTELILKAIEFAAWAPTNGGHQSGRFFVVKDRRLIDRIADAVQAKVDLMVTWPETAGLDKLSHHQAKAAFFRTAGAVILAGATGYEGVPSAALRLRGPGDPAAKEMIDARKAVNAKAQAVGAAITQMLLGLHLQGLGACWMGGPMLARREITEMLEVPADTELFALIAVGYPDEQPEPAPRLPMEEIVRVY